MAQSALDSNHLRSLHHDVAGISEGDYRVALLVDEITQVDFAVPLLVNMNPHAVGGMRALDLAMEFKRQGFAARAIRAAISLMTCSATSMEGASAMLVSSSCT